MKWLLNEKQLGWTESLSIIIIIYEFLICYVIDLAIENCTHEFNFSNYYYNGCYKNPFDKINNNTNIKRHNWTT